MPTLQRTLLTWTLRRTHAQPACLTAQFEQTNEHHECLPVVKSHIISCDDPLFDSSRNIAAMAIHFSWISLSLAGFTMAARLDSLKPTWASCSNRSPPPEDFQLQERFLHPEFQEEKAIDYIVFKVLGSPKEAEKCNTFVYLPLHDRFVTLKYDEAYSRGIHHVHMCKAADSYHDYEFCTIEQGSNVWKYGIKLVDQKCVDKLCGYAKSGKWNFGPVSWYSERKGRGKPWKRFYDYPNVGYEKVFASCWKGPKDYGNMLGDFNSFASRNKQLINTEGTFNKMICGCKTKDQCWSCNLEFVPFTSFCSISSSSSLPGIKIIIFSDVNAGH
eukprot:s737_g30.t1